MVTDKYKLFDFSAPERPTKKLSYSSLFSNSMPSRSMSRPSAPSSIISVVNFSDNVFVFLLSVKKGVNFLPLNSDPSVGKTIIPLSLYLFTTSFLSFCPTSSNSKLVDTIYHTGDIDLILFTPTLTTKS